MVTPAEHTDLTAAPRSRRVLAALRDHAYILPGAALALGAFLWMVTYGTGALLGRETFGQFYDGQAKALLAGRWDVQEQYIGDEAFLRDGKFYGYFGFVPAVFRIPAAVLMPGRDGRWSRLSQAIACAVSLAYAYRLLLEARRGFGVTAPPDRASKDAYVAFLLVVGLGSTLIFLASRSYVFHEAIVWGAALALGCYYHLVRYLDGGTRGVRHLAAACCFSFLAFFTRGTVGAGTVAALVLVGAYLVLSAVRRRRSGDRDRPAGAAVDAAHPTPSAAAPTRPTRPARDAALVAATVALICATFVAVNYAKFRTLLDPAPLHRYQFFIQKPERLARTGGKLMSLANVRTGARAYLSPSRIKFWPSFPWVYATKDAHVYPEARLDIIEPHASLPASTPALAALALAGVIGLWRLKPGAKIAFAIPLAGALAGGATTLAADALSHRYLHDFFPFLVIAGALGVHVLLALPRGPRKAVKCLAVPVVLFSLWANLAIALYFQRVYVWGVPLERHEDFRRWQELIDRHVGPAASQSGGGMPQHLARRGREPVPNYHLAILKFSRTLE